MSENTSTIDGIHEIVRPKIINGFTKNQIAQTNEDDNQHISSISIEIELNGVLKKLDLKLNRNLIAHGFKHARQHQGKYLSEIPENEELCHYQGQIQGTKKSWAAISTCEGLRGVIFDGEKMYHIHPKTGVLNDDHYLYKHDDFKANYTREFNETQRHTRPAKKFRLNKRSTDDVIRGPFNVNQATRYVELVFVIDKSEYINLNSNLINVHRYCKDLANIMNSLYRPFNIFIALVGIEVWTENDRINMTTDSDELLKRFLKYRMKTLVNSIPNDNAQLLTSVHFDNGIIGKAYRGLICSTENSGSVSVHHSSVVGLVAATLAHELAHNLGIDHDTEDCSCPDELCIMNPICQNDVIPIHWSACSFKNLSHAYRQGLDYCLRNKPKMLFDSPTCGNGFVERGEECDCGLPEKCNNHCCNAALCKLHPNASCATGTCCDVTRCTLKKIETPCRSRKGECDLPEYCDGKSEYCPQDVFKIDGEKCKSGKAFCHQGNCQSHSDQCRKLWGPSICISKLNCYDRNTLGYWGGNCGYDISKNISKKCEKDDVLCGRLYCNVKPGIDLKLGSSMISKKIGMQTKYRDDCQGVVMDFGLNNIDPGLVPNGAKCGDNKMCVDQVCMPVEKVKEKFYIDNSCANNCGGNGVCNSLGHCHCNRGFSPPDCQSFGYGGSIDSGFSKYYNDTYKFANSKFETCSDDLVDAESKVILNLKTYPNEEIAKPNTDVTLVCRDESPVRADVRWIRDGNLPLPSNSENNGNRLDLFRVKPEHSGVYICEAFQYPLSFPGRNASVMLTVKNI
ncbi:zinc metalloproteinase-disintegrin-like crotastatin [Aphidius gifuensis]|uniref:zinc metalloproteinase-disintegrin-like crotastatin n=1 Tax=Aphidius gifuensis TaxID=684658 RepID=UPI001CDD3244|nr:zinc metalloproteinase-disintegrin-like crotastatin [Aphidius gifuensis]